MSEVNIEYLHIKQRSGETLSSVFFSKSRSFRDYFDHEHFTQIPRDTGRTLERHKNVWNQLILLVKAMAIDTSLTRNSFMTTTFTTMTKTFGQRGCTQ